MAIQEFESVPPGKQVLILPAVLVLMPLVALALILATAGEQHTPLPWPAIVPVALLPLIGVFASQQLFQRKFLLSPEGLRLRTLPFPRTVPVSSFDLERAEIVDLGKREDLVPRFKIAGTRLPGFRSGRFYLRDKRRASVFLTELRKVLVLPLRDGSVVLLSLQRPEALLAALRARR